MWPKMTMLMMAMMVMIPPELLISLLFFPSCSSLCGLRRVGTWDIVYHEESVQCSIYMSRNSYLSKYSVPLYVYSGEVVARDENREKGTPGERGMKCNGTERDGKGREGKGRR